MTRILDWFRALFARAVPGTPMSDYYAWRDARVDRLADQAHRDPSARARGDDSPPVSRPVAVPGRRLAERQRFIASPRLHYHHDAPSIACFERHIVVERNDVRPVCPDCGYRPGSPEHIAVCGMPPGWLRWPDSPDGTL